MNDTKADKISPRQNGQKYVMHLNKVGLIGFPDGHRLTGKIVEVQDSYIVLQHRDGRHTTIDISQIAFLIEVKDKGRGRF